MSAMVGLEGSDGPGDRDGEVLADTSWKDVK